MVQAPNPKSSMVSRLWALKSVVLVLAFTGLLTSNIATLLSADFHDRVYSLLGRALAIVAGSAADRVTRHSKTAEVERAEVEKRKAEARVRKVEGEHMATKAELTKSQQEANHLRSKVHQADVNRKNDGRAAKEVASSAQRRFARTIAKHCGIASGVHPIYWDWSRDQHDGLGRGRRMRNDEGDQRAAREPLIYQGSPRWCRELRSARMPT